MNADLSVLVVGGDLLRPVADGRPDGFCKLIADRASHAILGGHVLGEYSAETVLTVAACMAAGMSDSDYCSPNFLSVMTTFASDLPDLSPRN